MNRPNVDRPNVVTRISKLKTEIERLRILATDCHPPMSTEISSLADDMNTHVSVLENFLANDPETARHERSPIRANSR